MRLSDYRAFSLFKTVPGCQALGHFIYLKDPFMKTLEEQLNKRGTKDKMKISVSGIDK